MASIRFIFYTTHDKLEDTGYQGPSSQGMVLKTMNFLLFYLPYEPVLGSPNGRSCRCVTSKN